MKVVLFDMDGTLTPARKEMTDVMLSSLIALSSSCKLGIISGSDYDYIVQQCGKAMDVIDNIDIMPCNGTKLYKKAEGDYNLVHAANMRQKISDLGYQKILKKLFILQAEIMSRYPELPYTVTFFHYRQSLLNWCPIGRSADHYDRSCWKTWDKRFGIREEYHAILNTFIKDQNFAEGLDADLTVALGGSTSFDIYPNGWDKTYGLRHYKDQDVYFIGDKCKPGGNDYHIFKKLNEAEAEATKAWQTSSPEETIQIIKDKLML